MRGSQEEPEAETEGLSDVENTVFVAVGKNVKENKSTLLWALQSFAGSKICLLHVHQPAHLEAVRDGSFSVNKLKQEVVKVWVDLERQEMHKLLNQYLLITSQRGVQASKVWIEMDNVEKGIIQIIAQHNVRWLVMGVAAEKHRSRKLSKLKSKKAIFVCQQAQASCHIWFTCNGYLIYTRARCSDVSSNVGSIMALSSSTGNSSTQLPESHADVEEDSDELEGMLRRFTSKVSVHSAKSVDRVVCTLQPNPLAPHEVKEDDSFFPLLHKSQDRLDQSSSVILLEEKSDGQATSEIYDKLEHAKIDAENSREKTFEESVRRWKAENNEMEATHKAEELESLCIKEIQKREEMEEVLARGRLELERMRNQHDQYTQELQMICEQKPVLESQLIKSHSTEDELEEKIIQAANLLIIFKEKRDKLQIERDSAIQVANRLRKLVKVGAADLCGVQFFAFSFWEINKATRDFDPSCKIGDGRYGSVYKGLLHHLKVAIKMLPSHGSQGALEFENEAQFLSIVRHPNLVNLIGTCPESRSLIYEYIENGSLEDRLACRGKTPPLSWQTRTKIASEICSALIFIHSNRPCMTHGNLKPSKVLLDPNFVSKLCDTGIYRLIPQDQHRTYTIILCNKRNPEASVYVDPEFLETGELTVESDVYSFGVVLLQLLTGRPALGVVKDVKCALEKEKFSTVLDLAAGEWPPKQAKNLARLALRCCEDKRKNRPDLASEVWIAIEQMRKICTSSSSDSKGPQRIPSHFVCPIFQEVMKDPHIAADGFTYEADAIKGWLYSGHETSPMTNLKLDHCDLLPNHALSYAIQEWRQQHS